MSISQNRGRLRAPSDKTHRWCPRILRAAIVLIIVLSDAPGIAKADPSSEISSGEQTHRLQMAQSPSGRYVLHKGKRYKLCRDYAENLKVLGDVPRRICEMPFDKRFKDIRKIDWESLDPIKHFDVVEEMEINIYDYRRSRNKSWVKERDGWEARKDNFLALARSGGLAVGRARFDLNHDGKVDTVYRIGRLYRGKSLCDPDRYPRFGKFGWAYYVRLRDDAYLSKAFRSTGTVDAFYYKGRVYLLVSSDYVVEPQSKRFFLRPICEFWWVK